MVFLILNIVAGPSYVLKKLQQIGFGNLIIFCAYKECKRAVIVAQLVEQSLPTPEVCSSNAVIDKLLHRTFVYCIENRKFTFRSNNYTVTKNPFVLKRTNLAYVFVLFHRLLCDLYSTTLFQLICHCSQVG